MKLKTLERFELEHADHLTTRATADRFIPINQPKKNWTYRSPRSRRHCQGLWRAWPASCSHWPSPPGPLVAPPASRRWSHSGGPRQLSVKNDPVQLVEQSSEMLRGCWQLDCVHRSRQADVDLRTERNKRLIIRPKHQDRHQCDQKKITECL